MKHGELKLVHQENVRASPKEDGVLMWITVLSKYIKIRHPRTKNISNSGDGYMEKKTCVECGTYIPSYRKFLCDDCYSKMLSDKLDKE